MLKVKIIADYNGGMVKINFLNANLEKSISLFGNPNFIPFYNNFVYNSISYKSVALFKTKDINNKSVNFYLNIENNFCLISKEDSSFYQRIN